MKRSTPWGQSDYSRQQAPGITWHSTPGHGGIELSEERIRQLPKAIAQFPTYAGRGWYEEDCDWSLVCLAFPDDFDARSCYYAKRQAESDYIRSKVGADYFAPCMFGTSPWSIVQRKAAEFERTITGRYSFGSMCWGSGFSGTASIDGDKTGSYVVLRGPSGAERGLPEHFTLEQAQAAGLTVEHKQRAAA